MKQNTILKEKLKQSEELIGKLLGTGGLGEGEEGDDGDEGEEDGYEDDFEED